MNLIINLGILARELREHRYKHGRYEAFTINDPKTRTIHKATVKDRIVHQLLVDELEPLFEPRFIYDSFSCRKTKGTHAGVSRLRTILRKASHNDTRTVYVLKCDIRQFFASVDTHILRRLIKSRVKDPEIMWLIDQVLDSFSNGERGIPLGNVTSQLFANVYLHELDWFVKQSLQVKWYVRYCDDFVIVADNKQTAAAYVRAIEAFVCSQLCLKLHPHKVTLRTWQQGVDFLGYVLKPRTTLLRPQTARRMVSKVKKTNITSYKGVCSHAHAHRFKCLLQTIVGGAL